MANKIEFKIFADATELAKGLGDTKKQFESLGRTSALVFGGITASIFGFVKAADFQNKAIAQVEQALLSTGGVAGKTLDELKTKAKDLQRSTLFGDDEILRNATTQLLTFTNIAGENFDRVQRAALDVATVLDTTGDGTTRLKDVSIQLGKALNDPVRNLSLLSRAGIQFSEEQTKIIKNLAESNKLSEAQALILAELEKKYGGQAAKAREVDSGLTSLKLSASDLAETIGTALLPTVKTLAGSLENITNTLENNPGFASFTAQALLLGAVLSALLATIGFVGSGVISAIGLFGKLGTPIAFLVKNLPLVGQSLVTIGVAGASAFVGWQLGRLIAEVTGLDKALQDLSYNIDLFGVRTNEELLKNAEAANKNAVLRKQRRDQELAEERAAMAALEQAEVIHQENIMNIKTNADILKLERLEEFQAQVSSITALQLQSLSDMLNAEVDSTKSAEEQKTKIVADELARREKLRQIEGKTATDAFRVLSNAFNVFLNDSKANAIAQKILAIGQAIVNTALGVTKALALGPKGIPIAKVIGALGAIEIATIAATSFAVGTASIPRDMTANVHKGEIIIPESFSSAIRSGDLSLSGPAEGGGQPGVIFDFTGANFNGVNEELVREIFTKASESITNRTLTPLPA